MTGNREGGAERGLIAAGAGLVLLGLLTGLVSGSLAHPRMGLASHLEGLMNGTLLIALGAGWGHVRLGRSAERLARWSLIGGGLDIARRRDRRADGAGDRARRVPHPPLLGNPRT